MKYSQIVMLERPRVFESHLAFWNSKEYFLLARFVHRQTKIDVKNQLPRFHQRQTETFIKTRGWFEATGRTYELKCGGRHKNGDRTVSSGSAPRHSDECTLEQTALNSPVDCWLQCRPHSILPTWWDRVWIDGWWRTVRGRCATTTTCRRRAPLRGWQWCAGTRPAVCSTARSRLFQNMPCFKNSGRRTVGLLTHFVGARGVYSSAPVTCAKT